MKFKRWDVSTLTDARPIITKNDLFFTTDTETSLVFKLTDADFTATSAIITLYNTRDKSLVNEEVDVSDNVLTYRISDEAIKHMGQWQAQVIFVNKSGKYTVPPVQLTVDSHIIEDKKPQLVDIKEWNVFIKAAELYLEEFKEEAFNLQKDIVDAEKLRKSAEETRIANEVDRIEDEKTRLTNEDERIANELARKEEMEKARYSRFSNHTYDEIGERLDTIESATFTSHVFDNSGAPGPKSLIRGGDEAGFYGFVQPHEFGTIEGNLVGREEMSASNLALALGITQGIVQNDETAWMKFHREGDVLFHPVKPLRSRISWNHIYDAGAVYGDGTIGVNPPNGRAGDRISVDGSNNAFVIEQIEDHWRRSGANIANVGDTIVARGFSNSENNGEFTVQSITDYQIVVNKSLVTEVGNKKASVYNKKDAVTQNAAVTIGGNVYDVLLLKGADHDPLDSYNDADRGLVGPNSDWNALILPLHEQAKVGDWAYKSYAGEVEDWGIGLTDKTLVTHHTLGEGSYRWMQETGDTHPSRRVGRGYDGASYGLVNGSWGASWTHGWPPALRLKQ